jgi:DNA-binding MarR family transcriptional regulator
MVATHNALAVPQHETMLEAAVTHTKDTYLESLPLIERLHRRFLDVVKIELERIGATDVNNVQSLILYNVNDDEITVGELTYRGYYLGSNVSYNVKKLVANGYLVQERSSHDRRSIRIRLTQKGMTIRQHIDSLYKRHVEALADGPVSEKDLAGLNRCLRDLERFWDAEIRYRSR